MLVNRVGEGVMQLIKDKGWKKVKSTPTFFLINFDSFSVLCDIFRSIELSTTIYMTVIINSYIATTMVL